MWVQLYLRFMWSVLILYGCIWLFVEYICKGCIYGVELAGEKGENGVSMYRISRVTIGVGCAKYVCEGVTIWIGTYDYS